MNTLIFLSGVGVGSLAASFVIVAAVLWANRTPSEEAKKRNDEVNKLLSDRNDISARMEKHLAVMAEWAQQRWDR